MSPSLLWLTAAVLGMAAAMVSASLGLGAAAIALVLGLPLILRGDRFAALSGILIGFGGLWLLLLSWQLTSGGALSEPGPWILVGAIPLAIGLIALAVRIARGLRSTRDIGAP